MLFGLWARRANNSKGEVVVNDSPVDCQSHRADRSIFSAEKIQDRWFKSASRNQKDFAVKQGLFLFDNLFNKVAILIYVCYYNIGLLYFNVLVVI